ncbi:MAG: hypothetical protein U1C33_03880, partial [Candidatus Cloacimonadaceae bacterium]|nr:hypothetical protein [Candidatus Cloacimonadaceae bacterium]
MLEFIIHQSFMLKSTKDTVHVTDHVSDHVSDHVKKLVLLLGENEVSIPELLRLMGLKHRFSFRSTYLVPAIKANLVEMT